MMPYSLRISAWFLALVAIMLRAALPVGWMPFADASGRTSLVICTGQGPLAPTGHSRQQTSLPGNASDICPFAAVGHLSSPGSFALVSIPLRTAWKTAIATRGQTALQAQQSYNSHAPRAPPVFV